MFKKEKKIIFVYLIIGISWVYFSQRYLPLFSDNFEQYNQLQSYNFLIFVLLSSLFSFLFLKKYLAMIRDNNRLLKLKEKDLRDLKEQKQQLNNNLEQADQKIKSKNQRFVKMIAAVSALNDNPEEVEEDFLTKILSSAVHIIPEADYGKIYIFEGEKCKFVSAVGHDFEILRKTDINKIFVCDLSDYNSKCIRDYTIKLEKLPKKQREEIIRALRPIKESIYNEIKVKGKVIGRISLDIAEESDQNFSNLSSIILESFAALASSHFAYKKYDKLQAKFTKELINSIIKILEMYDMYTKGHSEHVANLSLLLAEEMELSDKNVMDAYWAGMVHDIGKLLIPINILNKKNRLTDVEYDLIKRHPLWGSKSLSDSDALKNIARYIHYHHERWDGKGYPNGLERNEIPVISQILSVSDTWDAMTSDRSYRKSLTKKEALEEIKENRGSQFSPVVVDAFVHIMEKRKLNIEQKVKEKFNQLESKAVIGSENKLFENLFERSRQGIIILDEEFNVEKVNPYFLNVFGFQRNDVLGINIKDFLLPREKRAESEKNIEALKAGREINVKTYRQKKSGEKIEVEIQAFPVGESENEINYCFIYRDICEAGLKRNLYNYQM
ncbi:HD domain-containing phosphohydrolase [Halanaerobium hydrogeniformans]|uniref:PAS/PAC sensor protein n=1 Tax=Halanaerobium hydrogeniformans TaxID=656519 RepID=E4RPU2_HALHG|nr:HD domain-containing phosphohydrolase [Halanaerobium hydrogeniformans]ADQ13976.1 putative PAS/PAC sensor protein [Halanaerobium hydrogeniformans]